MKISNQFITATIQAKGAELTSLISHATEYLWQADPLHWGRHAPVLFPIVGKLKNDQYQYADQTYQLSQHGFARDRVFEVIDHQPDQASLYLKSDGEMIRYFPFEFELILNYKLDETKLIVSYQINNPASNPLFFSIGGHPAFNCPVIAEEKRNDYWLEWETNEPLIAHRLNNGLFSGDQEPIKLNGRKLQITDHLFDKDALVFKHLKSKNVSLCSPSQKWLTFHFDSFPYLGIWSKSDQSPFVCIEPWFGLADHHEHNGDITQKEGIQKLEGQQSFTCNYAIEIHNNTQHD